MLLQDRPLRTRPAAVLLAACAGLSVLAIAHHPQVHAKTPHAVLTGVAHLAAMDRFIHTVLIVFVLLMLYAFCVYARAVRGPLSLGKWALALFAIGCSSVIGAASIDGYFISAFGERYALLADNLQTAAIPIMTAAAIAIQILTKFGFFAMAGAAVAWAAELPGSSKERTAAGIAAGCAAVSEFVLVAVSGTLQPHSLAVIALLQAVWCAAFAWILWSAQE